MSGSAACMTVQEFMDHVRDATHSVNPFNEPEAPSVFEVCAAREAHEHALAAAACAFVWPFLIQQQADGHVQILLGNGTTIPAWPSLFRVGNVDQPIGCSVDLTIGTVGSARWMIEAEDFSGPDDWLDESENRHAARHGPFLGCPIVLDREACETAIYEIRHGRRATDSEIKTWAKEMWDFGGRPTRDRIIGEYKRSHPGATDESADAFWSDMRVELGLPHDGGRPSNMQRQKTDDFLARKPRPETCPKPAQPQRSRLRIIGTL